MRSADPAAYQDVSRPVAAMPKNFGERGGAAERMTGAPRDARIGQAHRDGQ
jgi:hypothetical protein